VDRPAGLIVVQAFQPALCLPLKKEQAGKPAPQMTDLARCAIHTQTNKPWTLRQCIDAYSAIGVKGIGVWRHTLQPHGAEESAKLLRDAGMTVPSLMRGGFFAAPTGAARQAAVDENRVCVDEARAIGAEMIVLVVGAVPGVALADAREQVAEGIAAVVPYAQQAGVKLAIEPLHPMYAADKSCVNRMAEARQICERLQSPWVGIAMDVYHCWWDPDLEAEIRLAGRQKTLFGYHVCDWRVDTRHLLTDRGLMGDGCIDLRTIRGWVEAAGFSGFNEVEVFSERYWSMDQHAYVGKIREAYLARV
jgi:sugar phosphate isomerase/epimerase